MIYYPKSRLKLELNNATSNPDYVDVARLHTLNEKPVYKKHELNIPEYMITEYKSYWRKYSLFWLFNYNMTLRSTNLYTPYFWEKI